MKPIFFNLQIFIMRNVLSLLFLGVCLLPQLNLQAQCQKSIQADLIVNIKNICDQRVTVCCLVTNATSDHTFIWSNGYKSKSLSESCNQSVDRGSVIQVTVDNDNGCQSTFSVYVPEFIAEKYQDVCAQEDERRE